MRAEICDIQIHPTCFVFTCLAPENDNYIQFTISESENDSLKLWDHLFSEKDYLQISFDVDGIQSYILSYIIENNEALFSMQRGSLANNLFKAVEFIKNDESKFKNIKYYKQYFKQINLFKIWGFGIKNNQYTIDDLKFSIRYPDMSQQPKTVEEIKRYSINNVNTIKLLLNETLGNNDKSQYFRKNKISIRDVLSEKYKIDMTNMTDIDVVEKIILYQYCKKHKINKEGLLNSRKSFSSIELKDYFPEWYSVKTRDIQNLTSILYDKSINFNKKELDCVGSIGNLALKLDLKGVSACVKPGIYTTGDAGNDKSFIVELDVRSMFPSIIKNGKLHPSHMTESFNEIYNDLVDLRFKSLESMVKDYAMSECLKKGLNAIWGKLGNASSFLYDPIMQQQIALHGQLFMLMLLDKLTDVVLDILIINTDSVIARVHNNNISKVKSICNEMSRITGLCIKEDLFYDSIVILDGNNYALQDVFDYSGKGIFDVNPGLNKNTSSQIIPIALKEYFRNETPIVLTIKGHKDIYDFCNKNKIDNNVKIIRSYACKNQYGEHFLNSYEENFPEPDYNYYVQKAGLIISKITQQQQTLF
jgi:hypothetical protein